MVITIDGPAGAGKSTVAKKVAKILGIFYLDTGAMYRAFTLFVLNKQIPLDDKDKIEKALDEFEIYISDDSVIVEGKDVTRDIRKEDVTANVSYISSLDFVRKKMVELQREIGKNRDIIVEGRDIGTVVFSNAEYKFYLDASIEERANRRLNDEKNLNGTNIDIERTIKRIRMRDNYDSQRDSSPLMIAKDALYIDSTYMTINEVCDFIIKKVYENKKG